MNQTLESAYFSLVLKVRLKIPSISTSFMQCRFLHFQMEKLQKPTSFSASWLLLSSTQCLFGCRAFSLLTDVKDKGGLISEVFSLWQQLEMPKHYPEHILFRWIVHRTMICYVFWELEKLSEIKLPLRATLNGTLCIW